MLGKALPRCASYARGPLTGVARPGTTRPRALYATRTPIGYEVRTAQGLCLDSPHSGKNHAAGGGSGSEGLPARASFPR